jgi:translation initiation factor IF-2
MSKQRIYEVSKEFHVSSEALLSMLRDLGFTPKNHMSVVDDAMLGKIQQQFKKQHDEAVKDIKKKTEIKQAINKSKPEKKPQDKPKAKPVQPKPNQQDKSKAKPVQQKQSQDRKKPKAGPQQHGKPGAAPDTKKDPAKPDQKSGRSRGKDKRQRGKNKKQRIREHQKDVQSAFKKTMASMDTDSRSRSRRRARHSQVEEDDVSNKILKVSEFVSVAELANQMDMPVNTIIAKSMELGMMVSVNQSLEMDGIILLADEFGFEVEKLGEYAEDYLRAQDDEQIDEEREITRPPVVTVMGHVDHGKTTLLDYIRKANVVDGESGGITQHIGAYSVQIPSGQMISFIDTPGHEAFTAMRARGASVTDIVILVVAADDILMPQAIEAIDHARAAGVPIIIAINKTDLPSADPERLKGDLSRQNVLVEDWGGTIQCQEISAKEGDNVDKLLEKVLLESEMLDLKADPDKKASGVIIDSQLDRGRGPVATILVQTGTLHVTEDFITGMITGRVRAMTNEFGERVDAAGPAHPVQIIGMSGVPRAGDTFYAVASEAEAKEIASQRRLSKREQDARKVKRVTLDDVYEKIKDGLIKELNLIIKADVDGSMEALTDSLTKIHNEEVRVSVIRQGVGGINENDVLLAAASGAIIIGFHVRPTLTARQLAEQESIDIKLYEIIYEAIEDVTKALSGLLSPKITEEIIGTVEVRELFKVPKLGTIAGCFVTDGIVKRNAKARLIRDSIEVYDGKISSLRRFKEDAAEVREGYECGIGIENFNDIKIGDLIEVVKLREEARSL